MSGVSKIEFDGKIPTSTKWKRVRSRKVCERCHLKKIRCDLKIPCSTCDAAGVADKCIYSKVEKPVYMNVRKDYVENLVREVLQLEKQLAIVTAHLLDQPGVPEKKMGASEIVFPSRSANNPMSLRSILESGAKVGPNGNPLVADQNLPHTRSRFTYMGDSACSKFSTKLQQYVLFHMNEDLPQLRLIGSKPPPKFTDPDLHWNNIELSDGFILPSKAEAHTLIDIAFKFLGVEYYLAMLHSFGLLIEKIYENYKPEKKLRFILNKDISRSQMAQFFAMCALGSLYSGSIADPKYEVPGTEYFKTAVGLLRDEFEEPTIDYVEALSQIGFYSYSLNRLSSAFIYTGLALRVALSMGLHRRASFWNNTSLDLRERERGRRLFYTLFIFDRLICAKLGYPVSIDYEDIDTELPSEIYFSELEYREFPNSKYMLAQIQIATLSTLIVTNIYGISQLQSKENKKNFVYNVHTVLSKLKECYDNLDPTLKLLYYNNQSLDNVLRNIYSFHMHYNQLIILATRPLLLYAFTRALSDPNFVPSQITTAIGEACIQSAYTINSVINTLYRTGKISSFGFFDSHYCFSSTIILIISKTLTNFDEAARQEIDSRIENANNILKSLSSLGSIPGSQFALELQNLEDTFKSIDISKVAKIFTKYESESFFRPQVHSEGDNLKATPETEQAPINQYSNDILQVPKNFALDDEILLDFLNSNFDATSENNTPGFQNAFKIDDFDQIDSIIQDLRE